MDKNLSGLDFLIIQGKVFAKWKGLVSYVILENLVDDGNSGFDSLSNWCYGSGDLVSESTDVSLVVSGVALYLFIG